MERAYYSDSLENFNLISLEEIVGKISLKSQFADEQSQKLAWKEEIKILKENLPNEKGKIFFEFSIPRMGKRIDVLLIIKHVIFILEFKIGEKIFNQSDILQTWDYALDLSNFHESSRSKLISPILIATKTKSVINKISPTSQNEYILYPLKSNIDSLKRLIENVLSSTSGQNIDIEKWENGKYSPTPTIIEAATSLYSNHTVEEISRSDAGAVNLSQTSKSITEIIDFSIKNNQKSICFVTGVPGAGKTLVGLNIATQLQVNNFTNRSVFLSGNGPLVEILCEALSRNEYERKKELGQKEKKGDIRRKVKSFIQNVHNFRDEYISDKINPPDEKVAIFDEAQRAWGKKQLKNFMLTKKGIKDFKYSEPEFLISCMDRHKDWAVIICLVGGGQEINSGEVGISEWFESISRSFNHWKVYYSENLLRYDVSISNILENINFKKSKESLHLSVSLRSFRSEKISEFVRQLLDLKKEEARVLYSSFQNQFPIVLTRDFNEAKSWLKMKASGSERYGMIVSSKAERLKPYSINVKNNPIEPIPWFLNPREDVRSSYHLEDVATEFKIQGLELDWVCVAWDADFRYKNDSWENWAFKGFKWQKILNPDRINFQKNAYRVLLTRARQGMVIVVPYGDREDNTRVPEYYDKTYEYLRSIGIETI